MIITLCNGKGGSGKTTVTVLLSLAFAAAGRRVAISDRDPQGTASLWIQDLKGNVPEIYQPGQSYDVVLIDTPPRLDAPQVREAVQDADKVLLVSSPSPADLWTTQKSGEVIKSYITKKRPVRVLFNQVQPGTLLAQELDQTAKRIGVPKLFSALRRRQCYQHAAVLGWSGLTVAAKEEVMMLAGEIISL